jgi:hypothetical protein
VILKPKTLVDRDLEVEREAALKAGFVLGPFDSAPQVRHALKEYNAKMKGQGRRSKKPI